MSITVASRQPKELKESGSVTRVDERAAKVTEEKERKRKKRESLRSGVNGTAKVYFVEEKAACHATMGPHSGDVGVPRGPRDQDDRGASRGRRGRTCAYVCA